jgi:DNA mismatch repair protein MutS2
LNRNTFRALEYPRIQELLLAHAGGRPGRERVLGLFPSKDRPEVRDRLRQTTEGVRLLGAVGRQPYHDLPDLTEVLPQLRVEGTYLEPLVLRGTASFIDGSQEIAQRVATATEAAPGLARLASEVKDLRPLAARITRCILPTGEVSDDASPRLLSTRRALTRLKSTLDQLMDGFLRSRDAEKTLQEKLVTTRNDRYVLLVKAEHRGVLPGIIHGSSSSGASLFVEPLAAVEINNDIVSASEEEREEVLQVLRSLTRDLGEEAESLSRTFQVMGELDFVQAKALLGREMSATEPQTGVILDLRKARHPLLMPALAERLHLPKRARSEPVPLDLAVGGEKTVLVVSGPNTGGKTVALKTAGLLALMAQAGLHIPAAEGSALPVFASIYADIGDDQSIAESLSTFSAHLRSIVEMARDLEEPALVLLDEVGGGTDPAEGGALGVSVVDHFRSRGAFVIATTHHGLLKAYALSEPGVLCGSFGYDPETYEPSFELVMGVGGRSLALEMAERLGLPESVVRDARSRLDQKEAQAEALLKTLEEDRTRLEKDRERLQEEREALEVLSAAGAERERVADEQRRNEVHRFRKEMERAGEEAARRMADAVTAAVHRVEASRRVIPEAARARTEAVRSIREAQKEALGDFGLPGPELPDVQVGDRVRVAGLAVIGEVLSFQEKGVVELACSGKRLRVERSAVSPVGQSAPPSGAAPRQHFAPKTVPSEINLVGLTVEEALPQVDKLLDDAALGETRSLRLIHGFGSGRLRKAVASLLEGHPHVAAFRSGAAREGGGGVTVVELKD